MRKNAYETDRAALTAAIEVAASDYEAAVTARCAFDVANPGPTPVYFTGPGHDWDVLENWSEDAAGAVPAASLPEAGEAVVILHPVDLPPAAPITLGSVVVDNVQAHLGGITSTGGFLFKRSGAGNGEFTGDAVFEDGSGLNGTMTGNAVFKDGSCLAGMVVGNAVAHYPVAYPLSGTVTGTLTYEGGYQFGCTNPEATNYNPEANTDDGSCIFE